MDAKRYLVNLRSPLWSATLAWLLMFAFGYPPEDWIGVFGVWYASLFVISYATLRVALLVFGAYGQYVTRVAEQVGVRTSPTSEEIDRARLIASSVAYLLLLLLLGASLTVTSMVVPLVGLSDLGPQFKYISVAVLGVGFMGILAFFAVTFALVETAKRLKQYGDRPRVKRFQVPTNAVDELLRLREKQLLPDMPIGR